MTDVTDTPATSNPPSRLDRIKGFIGDLARPFAIVATSLSAAIASVVTAFRVDSGGDGAALMGAIYFGVAVLYGAKSWENAKTGKHSAEVEIAKATTPPTT